MTEPEPVDHLLTLQERSLVRLIANVYNQFCELVPQGPARRDDLMEVVFHVHALQRMIMAQAAARAYPDEFRPLGAEIRDIRSQHQRHPGVSQ